MPDLTVGAILVGVIAGAILLVLKPDIEGLYTRIRQDNPIRRRSQRRRAEQEARRLLADFQQQANGNLIHAIAIDKSAARANVDDPGPAVALLKERGLIIGMEAGTRPTHVRLTRKGLRADENAV